MNENKKIEPTVAMILDAASTGTPSGTDARTILRAALNHPDAAGLFADEAVLRVARELGWDNAADWVQQREAWTDEELRAANPYRPAPDLPTGDGAIIIPAEGRGCVEAGAEDYYHLTYNRAIDRWVGVNMNTGTAELVDAHHITPGTWKVADK